MKLQRQPSREILKQYRRESHVRWLAIDVRAIDDMLTLLVSRGITFTKAMAIIDLHYAVNQQEVQSYRHYATRWKWSPKRVYRLFVELGFYGSKGVENVGAAGEHSVCNGEAAREPHCSKSRTECSGREHERANEEQEDLKREPPLLDNRKIDTRGGNARDARVREEPGHQREEPLHRNGLAHRADTASTEASKTEASKVDVSHGLSHRTFTGANHDTSRGRTRKHPSYRGSCDDRGSRDDIEREIARSEALLNGMFEDRRARD